MTRANRSLADWSAEEREIASKLRPKLQIQSEGPIVCSLPRCVALTREITDGAEWIAVNTRAGMIIGHLICFGINPNGNLADAEWQKHIGRSVVNRFQS